MARGWVHWRRDRDRELDEEIRIHLRLAVRDRIAAGESPADAEAAARREFGNVALTKQVAREARGWVWLDQLAGDVRLAVRMLAKRPLGTATAIATLALALGANVAIFSIVDRVVFHPVPLPGRATLVAIQERFHLQGRTLVRPVLTYDTFQSVARANTTFEQFAAAGRQGTNMAVSRGDAAQWLRGMYVTPNYLHTLGLAVQAGRDFSTRDDAQDAAPVAIVSDRAWRTRFDASPEMLGRTLTVNGAAVPVVGIGPRDSSTCRSASIRRTSMYRSTRSSVSSRQTTISARPAACATVFQRTRGCR